MMNLTTDPWIPVVYGDGDARDVSLVTLFEDAGRIRDLAVNPPQRVSLMRLLICITQRALDGPDDERDWYGSRDRIRPASLDYLDKHRDCFDLYGDKAFLQARGLNEPTKRTHLDKLEKGSNLSALFDHEIYADNRDRSDKWRALSLVTFQSFAPSGTIQGPKWNGMDTAYSGKHAPCLESSMLHTFIMGENLNDTVFSNLLTKECIDSLPNLSWGKPVWEEIPHSPDSQIGYTYLGRLVPYSRAIKLFCNQNYFIIAGGVEYPKLPEVRETTATVMRNKKEDLIYVNVDPFRHPWRELSSILSLKENEGGTMSLRHLALLQEDVISIWTGGVALNRDVISKALDVGEWMFQFNKAISLKMYQTGVEKANTAVGILCIAVTTYDQKLKLLMKSTSWKQKEKMLEKAKNRFWSILDTRYEILIDAATAGEALDDTWYPVVRKAMEEAYEYACPHTTPRQIQAYALGIKRLRLKKFNDTVEVV